MSIVDVAASQYYNIEVPAWKVTSASPTIVSPVSFGGPVLGGTGQPDKPADLVAGRVYTAYVAFGADAQQTRRESVTFTVR